MRLEELLLTNFYSISGHLSHRQSFLELFLPLVELLPAETLDGREVETDGAGKVRVLENGHFKEDGLS